MKKIIVLLTLFMILFVTNVYSFDANNLLDENYNQTLIENLVYSEDKGYLDYININYLLNNYEPVLSEIDDLEEEFEKYSSHDVSFILEDFLNILEEFLEDFQSLEDYENIQNLTYYQEKIINEIHVLRNDLEDLKEEDPLDVLDDETFNKLNNSLYELESEVENLSLFEISEELNNFDIWEYLKNRIELEEDLDLEKDYVRDLILSKNYAYELDDCKSININMSYQDSNEIFHIEDKCMKNYLEDSNWTTFESKNESEKDLISVCDKQIKRAINISKSETNCDYLEYLMLCPENNETRLINNSCVVSSLQTKGWSTYQKIEEISDDESKDESSDSSGSSQRETPSESSSSRDDVSSEITGSTPSNLSTDKVNETKEINDSLDDVSINDSIEEKTNDSKTDVKNESVDVQDKTSSRREAALNRVQDLRSERGRGVGRENISNETDYAVKNITDRRSEVAKSVHSIREMSNFTGQMGPRISEIARDINESMRNLEFYEESISNRGRFSRFFFGGDINSAREIQNQTSQNEERIEEIQSILNESEEIPNEVKDFLEEEIDRIKSEQDRLKELSENETNSRGIFSRIIPGFLR